MVRLRTWKNALVFGIVLTVFGVCDRIVMKQTLERSRLTIEEVIVNQSHIVNKPSPECDDEVVHLALCVRSVDDARQAAAMLKTVFHSRSASVDLHVIVGSELMFTTINTLLNTWDLSRLKFAIHRVPKHLIDRRKWPLVKFMLHELLPVNLDRILYLSNDVRLIDDVGALWWHVFVEIGDNMSKKTLFAVVPVNVSSKCSDDHEIACRHSYDVMGINMVGLREQINHSALSINSSLDQLDLFFETIKDQISTAIDCSWAVRLTSSLSSTGCLPVKGVIWTTDSPLTNLESEELERAREIVMIIAASKFIDGVHRKSRGCRAHDSKVETDFTSGEICSNFRREARLKRRTHLNFFTGTGNGGNHDLVTTEQTPMSGKGVDVTLATQLTIDRFAGLERMLSVWDGPASVAFHVNDDEVDRLTSMITGSATLKEQKNVVYHVVYKRLFFNPINYLRNVAVNNSYTTHVFYIDVDLVPSAGVYQQLKTWIEQFQHVNVGEVPNDLAALIIPTFSADTMINVPSNKSQLLQLMKNGKVEGYKMKRGWNLGHKPTNFTQWMVTDEPYCVTYQNAFEPYVVVRMSSTPRFNEQMLERFADKALYVRNLHAMGFKLCVLPDVFAIHLPHESSDVHSLYRKRRDYGWCSSVISDEYKAELSSRFPKVVF